MASVHDADPTSSTLWKVEEIPNGGKKPAKIHHLVWSDTPDAANRLAVAFWGQYDKSSMDNMDNVDGNATKSGECYQGFACVAYGSASVSLFVDSVHHNPWCLGTNAIKKALKSRGLDTSTNGTKGDAAKQLLGTRLKGYISAAPSEVESEVATSSIEVESQEPPPAKKMKAAWNE